MQSCAFQTLRLLFGNRGKAADFLENRSLRYLLPTQGLGRSKYKIERTGVEELSPLGRTADGSGPAPTSRQPSEPSFETALSTAICCALPMYGSFHNSFSPTTATKEVILSILHPLSAW